VSSLLLLVLLKLDWSCWCLAKTIVLPMVVKERRIDAS